MAQKVVSTVRFEIPVGGEDVEGHKTALDKAEEIKAAIEAVGGVVTKHTIGIRQSKKPRTPKSAQE